MRRLNCKTLIPSTLDKVWDFFSNPRNLSVITPEWLSFKILEEKSLPKEIYPGLIICYQVRPFPFFKSTWVTEITQAEKEKFFVDDQRSGPYSFWHHQHLFANSNNGVIMEDIIHYQLPGKSLGDFLFASLTKRQLKKIFSYRSNKLEEIFPGSKVLFYHD